MSPTTAVSAVAVGIAVSAVAAVAMAIAVAITVAMAVTIDDAVGERGVGHGARLVVTETLYIVHLHIQG